MYRDIAENQQQSHGATRLLRIVLVMLLVVAVFDPADLILHVKVPLFAVAWIIVIIDLVVATDKSWPITYKLLLYVMLFTLVLPLSSIMSYFVQGGNLAGYDGFQYFKAYLFLSLSVLLAIKRIDLVRPLSILLTIMSLLIVVTYIVTYNNAELRWALLLIGDTYGSFALNERSYGSFSYNIIYFQASPLLVISLGYFTYRWIHTAGRAKVLNGVAILLNMLGMFWSGTRNNMFASVLVPLCVGLWYSRRKLRIVGWASIGALGLIAYKSDVLLNMFSAGESDNAIKLVHARDYMAMFQHWPTLLWGQGLGARFHSTIYGYTSVTELTYFDILRTYGLIGAAVVLVLLLYPMWGLQVKEQRDSQYLYITYGIYLFICASNPILFSSNGILLLALVIYRCCSAHDYAAPRLLGIKEAV